MKLINKMETKFTENLPKVSILVKDYDSMMKLVNKPAIFSIISPEKTIGGRFGNSGYIHEIFTTIPENKKTLLMRIINPHPFWRGFLI